MIRLSVHGHVRTVLFTICMWNVCSNIVIGLSVLDHVVSVVCYVCGTCVVITSDSTVRTGHVVSAVCFVSGWWDPL